MDEGLDVTWVIPKRRTSVRAEAPGNQQTILGPAPERSVGHSQHVRDLLNREHRSASDRLIYRPALGRDEGPPSGADRVLLRAA